MLPSRLNIFKTTEDQLKKIKQKTGITPNIYARIALCISLEQGTQVTLNSSKVDGTLNLDKNTWLGEYAEIYEILLANKYPHFNSKQLEMAWAMHIADGHSRLNSELV